MFTFAQGHQRQEVIFKAKLSAAFFCVGRRFPYCMVGVIIQEWYLHFCCCCVCYLKDFSVMESKAGQMSVIPLLCALITSSVFSRSQSVISTGITQGKTLLMNKDNVTSPKLFKWQNKSLTP